MKKKLKVEIEIAFEFDKKNKEHKNEIKQSMKEMLIGTGSACSSGYSWEVVRIPRVDVLS